MCRFAAPQPRRRDGRGKRGRRDLRRIAGGKLKLLETAVHGVARLPTALNGRIDGPTIAS
jgi:hypothetical protein